MHNQARRPSLALGLEDPVKTKALRKKKFLQLTQQQIKQLKQQQQQEAEGGDGQHYTSPRLFQPINQSQDIPVSPKGKEQEKAKEQEPEHPHVNFNIFPYYYDVVKCHTMLKSSSTKEQLRGALEIGEVAWNGGELAQTFLGKCGVLKTLTTLLDNSLDNQALRLRIIQSFGIICRSNIDIQNLLVDMNYVHRLYTYLFDNNPDIRKWTTNTMFYLLHACPNAHHAALAIGGLKERLETVQRDDWSNWDFNDAKEILKMLRLHGADDA